jgi:hypothetical protein
VGEAEDVDVDVVRPEDAAGEVEDGGVLPGAAAVAEVVLLNLSLRTWELVSLKDTILCTLISPSLNHFYERRLVSWL